MTRGEFVATLKDSREIQFPNGPRLDAHPIPLAAMLADTLAYVIRPADALIHSGWQSAAFEDGWRGEHIWWLVLDRHLLKLRSALSDATENITGGAGQTPVAKVDVRSFTLRKLAMPDREFSYVDRMGLAYLQEVRVIVSLSGDRLIATSEPGAPGAVSHFVDHLEAAIVRASAARGQQ